MPQLRTSSTDPHSASQRRRTPLVVTSRITRHAGWSQIPHYSRIFGIETEYGVAVTGANQPIAATQVAMEMFKPVVSRERSTNTYMDNGSRLYLDVGSHPEYATAESRTVLEAVAQDAAGEQTMARLVQSCQQRLATQYGEHTRVHVFKNNVDSQGHSFGCHENYLLRRQVPLRAIEHELIPFLVTRSLFTGAGRVSGSGNNAYGFELTQRADFLDDAISSATTRVRPMVNTRDEPHADSDLFRRLHVIVGDSNRSQIATWMKLATTHLVLCVIEAACRARALGETSDQDVLRTDIAGDGPFAHLQLANPTEALRQVSQDITGTVPLALAHGGSMSAIAIQREYLRVVRDFVRGHSEDTNIAFPQVQRVLERWQLALDALESGQWQDISTWVDWACKLRIIEGLQHRAQQQGHTLSADQLQQLDLDYHDVANGAIFPKLVSSGQMEVLIQDTAVEQALSHAPRGTRAQLRAQFLQAVRRTDMRYSVDWTHVQLQEPYAMQAQLLDPFNAQPTEQFSAIMDVLTGKHHG